ncbi:SMI1/KNR4 family protein [Winogradskya consettensis]|uniref:Knr4/Smi1-like domain-containing protein n=1 Tax=Winogradskya consettensis TaxID=113560 RepID=A0A919VUJ2_9ACTN|nr:SMI1/KNR4 family protein [Actinoplanes consettensis]GIM75805.1 hypothetical protein Aco04nite_47170 [Actinoplanes consettensis]
MTWNPAEIRARLAAAHAADPALERFHGMRNGYLLGPPLTDSQVAVFEGRHGITLPEDYRTFLLEVGNGGAGPHHGLFPLGQFPLGHVPSVRGEGDDLSAPFPHTEEWNDRTLSEDDYFDDRWVAGSMVVGEYGSGAFYRLVVTGPARGRIWFDSRGSDQGMWPESTFHTWYSMWVQGLV